jgi:A/G-specific adenine glycosylase
MPTLFIETNIRTVIFHHFFANQQDIEDAQVITILETIIDRSQPRRWYWAMMDYGADLKKHVRNTTRSKHYKKQSVFAGSDRQLRSILLRTLLGGPLAVSEALTIVESKQNIIDTLLAEGMIIRARGKYRLAH